MNGRIQELAIDCAGQIEWDAPKNPESFTFNRDELQKFAELIVRECVGIVNRKEYSDHEADPLWETAQLIKEHFGVTWVGLTDDEINSWDLPDKPTVAEFVRFVEAKLRSKNT